MKYQTLNGLTPEYIESLKKRFWTKVDIRKPNECWEWEAAKNSKGYGQIGIWGKSTSSHRIAYELKKGPIGNLFVCHKCDNPSCVNPNHLFLGDARDNMQDAKKKGRLYYQKYPSFKQLKIKFKKEIDDSVFPKVYKLRRAGLSGLQIAAKLNIGKSSVYRILNGTQRKAADEA